MTTYVDSSALLKRYVDEIDSPVADELLGADPVLVSSWVTAVEVRRNLAQLLEGNDLLAAQTQFSVDLDSLALVVCDEAVATGAAAIGETLRLRSLDAIHLASAQRLRIENLTFVTFDLHLGQAARSVGLTVRGC